MAFVPSGVPAACRAAPCGVAFVPSRARALAPRDDVAAAGRDRGEPGGEDGHPVRKAASWAAWWSVGVDGSGSGPAAAEEAAREARWRGAALRVVHAFIRPRMRVPLGPSSYGPPEGGLRNLADRLVAEAVERAVATAPEVEVGSVVVPGEPSTVLEAESRGRSWSSSVPGGRAASSGSWWGRPPCIWPRTADAPCWSCGRVPAPVVPWSWVSTDLPRARRRSTSPSRRPRCAVPACSPSTPGRRGMRRCPRRRTPRCTTRTRRARSPRRRNVCWPRHWRGGGRRTRVSRSSTGSCAATRGRHSSRRAVRPGSWWSAPGGAGDSRGCCWDR